MSIRPQSICLAWFMRRGIGSVAYEGDQETQEAQEAGTAWEFLRGESLERATTDDRRHPAPRCCGWECLNDPGGEVERLPRVTRGRFLRAISTALDHSTGVQSIHRVAPRVVAPRPRGSALVHRLSTTDSRYGPVLSERCPHNDTRFILSGDPIELTSAGDERERGGARPLPHDVVNVGTRWIYELD